MELLLLKLPLSTIKKLFLFDNLGFEKITIFGQEGITATRLSMLEKTSQEVRDFYLKLSINLCEVEQYFSYSCHVMYIGKK